MSDYCQIDENNVFTYPRDQDITGEDLNTFIKANMAIETYNKNEQMYKGHYAIADQEDKPLNKPDNRIAINFAKYLVNVFNGFFAGVPPTITSTDESQNDKLQAFNNRNSLLPLISKLAKETSKYGRVYAFLYRDEEQEINVAMSKPQTSFMVYDTSVGHKPLYFVRYYKDDDGIHGECWSDKECQYFEDEKITQSESHPFAAVPAVEFSENDERMPLFDESAVSIMDGINNAMSQKANDVEAIADAYLFFKGGELTPETIENMQDNRVIANTAENGDAKFLERPNGDGTQEHLIDRLTRYLFQTTMVTNLDDVNATGNDQSGYSIELKMQGMRSLASVKEQEFTASLRELYRIVFNVEDLKVAVVEGTDQLTPLDNIKFQFTRNLPKNVEVEATIANTLEGIVSKETQLKALPSLVDSPREEIEQMQKEQSEQLDNAVNNSQALKRDDDGEE